MITTTLNKIRAHSPCQSSWARLLESLGKTAADDEPLPMGHILDTLGIDDCLWAARTLPEHSTIWRLFAADCAEQVLPMFERVRPDDNRPRLAIEAARRNARREMADDELDAARDAAVDAAVDAARAALNAARAARVAAVVAAVDAAGGAAGSAAGAAAGGAAGEWQAERLRKYLNGEITDNAASDGGEDHE